MIHINELNISMAVIDFGNNTSIEDKGIGWYETIYGTIDEISVIGKSKYNSIIYITRDTTNRVVKLINTTAFNGKSISICG